MTSRVGMTWATWAVAAALRALVLAVLWVALAGWDADYAVYGIVSVSAATALSLVLMPPGSLRVGTWPRRIWFTLVLVAWFLGQSVRGGVDVAMRALRRRPDIEPAVFEAPVRIPAGAQREIALLLMNLMPGSMVQKIITPAPAGDPLVELHTLSPDLDPVDQWHRLEERVAAAFAVRLQ